MNEGARKIEIFEPFGRAIDLTKKILFEPFDFGKWLVIGFAAFLAGLADGTRTGFPSSFGDGNFKGQAVNKNLSAAQEEFMSWLVSGLVIAVLIGVVVLVLLFMWIGSRGRFIFIDCIVRNRGAIAEPWREFKRQGNSLFLFSLASMALSLLLMGVLALPLAIPYLRMGEFGDFGVGTVIYLILAVALLVLIGIAWAVLVWFMVPVMYRQRCGALEALRIVARLIGNHPVPFILYVLFVLVLMMAGAIVSCLLTCATCCIAAIPYVGSVILLPLYMFYYAYTLLFLRQFGPEYDVWAEIGEPTATAPLELPPGDAPPLQA